MGKTLVLRYAAFGDWLYAMPTMRHLFEAGEDVYLHTNMKGYHIFLNDDRLKELSWFEPFTVPKEHQKSAIEGVWQALIDRIRPDTILHLSNTIEGMGLARKEDPKYWKLSYNKTRKVLGRTPFAVMPLALYLGSERNAIKEIEDRGYAPMAFTQEEIKWAEDWRDANMGRFIVLMPLHGTTLHKQFPQCRDWAETILKKYPLANVYIAGDGRGVNKPFGFDGRVSNTIGAPIRQLMLMARYADLVIGPPTGLLTASVMWGTPRIYLATDASVRQLTYGSIHDFSIQSTTKCSPCNRAIYEPSDCFTPVRDSGLSECSYNFDKEEVMRRVDLIYEKLPWRFSGKLRTPLYVSQGEPHLEMVDWKPEPLAGPVEAAG